MPCYVNFRGLKSTTKTFMRTKVTVDQSLDDEYGISHGTLKTQTDGSIKATVMENDGVNVAAEQGFFLCERPGDEKMCTEKGYVAYKGNGEGMIKEAQEWATKHYRTYVHSHDPNPGHESLHNFC